MVGVRTVEEPKYAAVASFGEVEIRRYEARVAADAVVSGDEDEARSDGFRKVAGYIFGANKTNASIAMTAPVVQERAEDGWRIRFFMPSERPLDQLPAPNDGAVRLGLVPAETYAVLRFTGARDSAAIEERRRALLAALDHTPWKPTGAPVAWFYDPPWTIPFLRRNEVAVTVEPR